LDTIKPNMLLPSLGMSKTDPNEITINNKLKGRIRKKEERQTEAPKSEW
jgi:hypothetical protein